MTHKDTKSIFRRWASKIDDNLEIIAYDREDLYRIYFEITDQE